MSCKGTTKLGTACGSKVTSGSSYCYRHGKLTKNCQAPKCSKSAKYNMLFCEEHDGKQTCTVKTKTGKLCGYPNRKHPWCTRHGDMPKDVVPVYNATSLLTCATSGCMMNAMEGSTFCKMHMRSRCVCPGCTSPSMMSSVYCVKHAAEGCQKRLQYFMSLGGGSGEKESQRMASECGSKCCGSIDKQGNCRYAACTPGTCDRDEDLAEKASKRASRAGKKKVVKTLKENACEECGTLITVG